MSLEWLTRPQHKNISLLISSYCKIKPQNPDSYANRCVRWVHSPWTIDELIKTEDFLDLLCSGVVFFHNRKPSVSELLFRRLKIVSEYYEILPLSDNKLTLTDYENENWNSLRKTDRIPILLIESSSDNDIVEILNRLDINYRCNKCGVWIRGYIDEVETFIPSFFNAMFFFDTSTTEFDILRKRIAISDSMIQTIREQKTGSAERVIFFWNYEKASAAPLIDTNPKVLSLSDNDLTRTNRERINKVTFINQGGLRMNRDTYNVGQAGAVGPNAHAQNITFTQIGNQIEELVDLSELADELSRLRQAMKKEAVEAEHDIAVSEVAKAEQAAKAENTPKVAEHLKAAGKWALDIAVKLSIPVAIEALKKSLGFA